MCDNWICTWTAWNKNKLPIEIIKSVRTNALTEAMAQYQICISS